jgi:hypothetical protein
MKKRLVIGIFSLLIAGVPFSSLSGPQETPDKKPTYDYWSSFFSRNTKPLGLKEDQAALKKLQRQSTAKWAVRTGIKHLLS